jgi:hypothetical protein
VKQPVWILNLEATTNAPLAKVVASLLDGNSYHRWHPRHRSVQLQVLSQSSGLLEFESCVRPCLGVEEHAVYRVEVLEDRVSLVCRTRFKGYPVLLLMGWWRLRMHRMWERFVESL